jgi:hypothetical protein
MASEMKILYSCDGIFLEQEIFYCYTRVEAVFYIDFLKLKVTIVDNTAKQIFEHREQEL